LMRQRCEVSDKVRTRPSACRRCDRKAYQSQIERRQPFSKRTLVGTLDNTRDATIPLSWQRRRDNKGPRALAGFIRRTVECRIREGPSCFA
jgi:hypothetical protein